MIHTSYSNHTCTCELLKCLSHYLGWLIHGTALIQLVITLPAEIPWGFDNFQRYKIALTSSNDSLRSLNVYCSSPRPLPYFILPMKALCGALGKDDYGISVLSILQSQKMDPLEISSHTNRSRCACVWL
jgi:hypothetical protein